MNRLTLALVLVLTNAAWGNASDYEPVVCTSASAYRGKALRAPVSAEVFAALPPIDDRPVAAPLAQKLDGVVYWILENTCAPGVTAAVAVPGHGFWSTSRGLARTSPQTRLDSDPYFYWASAGKACTATIILQLIEEKKLRLEDPLAKWFPRFPQAPIITIEHLLTHTSGIYSFNSEESFRKKKGYTPPQDLIAIAQKKGNVFCPGEWWSYSNTGYVLLGRIIEQIEERPYHAVVQRRIIDRLGLKRMRALAPRQILNALAIGHKDKKPDLDFEPSTPFSAGVIVASAADMLRFWHAFLSGKLVSKARVHQAFARLYPMFDANTFYGHGVMVYTFRDDNQEHLWLGHSGGTESARAIVAYDTTSRVTVAVALNGAASAEASANKLLKEVRAHLANQITGKP